MIFKHIKMKKQHITKHMVEEGLHICYDNISFSTFPYNVYGLKSSKHTLQQYNSGNCIALSLFLKSYLKNMGIISYLIPASVPKVHMVDGVKHICHVSLLIPYDKDKFFIVDPAFYFLNPLDCQPSNNIERVADTVNIHTDKHTPLRYKLTQADEHNQFETQCTCYFEESINDPWHYYVQEISLEDADTFIGATFMTCKPEPFIVKTTFDLENNTVKKLYHIKRPTPHDCIIIKGTKEVYNGPIKEIPPDLLKLLKTRLFKYFNKNIF
jgi:hypothetical protein